MHEFGTDKGERFKDNKILAYITIERPQKGLPRKQTFLEGIKEVLPRTYSFH